MRKIIFIDGFHNVFFIVATVVTILTLISSAAQFYSQFDFVILRIDQVCEQPRNNRCVDHYLVKRKDGSNENMTMSAFKFRESELAVGNLLRKDRYSLNYWVNGRRVGWEYLLLHVIGLALSGIGLGWWQHLSKIRRAQI